MARLNIERQQQLEPKRINAAIQNLTELGFEITHRDSTKVVFLFKGEKVQFFPYSGWHSGKTIKDGRGWQDLKSQLTSIT